VDWRWDGHIGNWIRDRTDVPRLSDPPATAAPAAGPGHF
jgi:hypothetical protein